MRTRTTDNTYMQSWSRVQINPGCSTSTVNTGPYPTVAVGDTRFTGDVVTPRYHSRRKAGEVIVNPFVSEVTRRFCSLSGPSVGYSCCVPAKTNTTTTTGPFILWRMAADGHSFAMNEPVITQEEIDDMKRITAAKAWSETSASDAQLLVFLAELRKTISLLRNPSKSALDFLAKVRRAKNSSKKVSDHALSVGQYMANEWLTWRYGWLQLKRDIESICQAIGRDSYTGLKTSRGTMSLTKERLETKNFTWASGVYGLNYSVHTVDTVKVKSGILHSAELDVDNFLGLTWENVVPTVWELLPLSFVIDWVVNVQSYLSSLLPQALVPTKGTYTVVRRNIRSVMAPSSTYWADGNPSGCNYFTQEVEGAYVIDKTYVNRTPSIADPQPRINLKIRDFMDARVLDSLALIAQRLRSR